MATPSASAASKNPVQPSASAKRQVRPRSERRQQLIDATIRCIAERGLSATTLQQVTREAGLSQGIANLHFQSKENLLAETLRYVTAEYNRGLLAVLEDRAGHTLSSMLENLLTFQLSRGVTQRQKMAVWFAFYGEAGARPLYQHICSSSDRLSERKVAALFAAVIADGQYPDLDARQLATGYLALIDGLWLGLLVTPRELNKRRAQEVARSFLKQTFPQHVS